jgi:KUP system potassium uptake protein
MSASAAPDAAKTHHAGGHGGTGLAAVVAAVGIVFGDIATSPLYTLQECLSGPHGVHPDRDNVLGCVSLVAWSLILVVSVKYVAIMMRADNNGEGGIMALLALVPRRLREKKPGSLGVVTLLVLGGAAFLFGDGVITPAISVLSAVEGLKLAAPGLEPLIVPITIVILIGLFAVQSRGSGKLGKLFGPVMCLWLGTALIAGVVHVARRPEVLQALSPHHAVGFMTRNGFHGFRVLGGVVLSVTGGEALYADMGHFGRKPIQMGWYFFALPALILCYLGQASLLIGDPGAAKAPFFSMLPSGAASYPFILLGTMATVIASQALITGVFSLTHQAMQLGYFPRLTVLYTSSETKGQIYLPLINWFLGISCIALVIAFRSAAALAGAFGLAVSSTMLATTLAFYAVARLHFGWKRHFALLVCAGFLVVDLAFVVANALKFFDGGYVPAILGIGFFAIMVCWARGRSLLGNYLRTQAAPADRFLAELDDKVELRLPGVGVVMTASADAIPAVLNRAVGHFRSLHETVLLTTIVTDEVPWVNGPRHTVEDMGKGIHRVILRYGFMEDPSVHRELTRVLGEIAPDADPKQMIYLLGHERSVAGSGGQMGRVAEGLFALLFRNARNPSDYYQLPPTQVVELGARVDL